MQGRPISLAHKTDRTSNGIEYLITGQEQAMSRRCPSPSRLSSGANQGVEQKTTGSCLASHSHRYCPRSRQPADDTPQHGLEKGGFSYIVRIRVPSHRPVHTSYMLTPTTLSKSNAFIRPDAARKIDPDPSATDPSLVMHATTPRKIYPVTPKQHTHPHLHLNTPSEEIPRNKTTDGPEPSPTPSPHSPARPRVSLC
jgi:hypothetical protein